MNRTREALLGAAVVLLAGFTLAGGGIPTQLQDLSAARHVATADVHKHTHEENLMVPRTTAAPAPRLEPRVTEGGPSIVHGSGFVRPTERAAIETLHSGRLAFEPTLGFTEDGALLFQGMEAPGPTGLDNRPTVLRTDDGGESWEEVSPAGPQFATTLDPYLYVDPRTSRAFTVNWVGPCSTIAWTKDAGETWDSSLGGCGLGDHEQLFAGPPRLSRTLDYPNVVYYCANGGFIEVGAAGVCQKSLDGGRTFVPTGAPPFHAGHSREEGVFDVPGSCAGLLAPGVVDDHGVIYLPAGSCGQPWLAISEDEGATWERLQVAGNGMAQGDEAFNDNLNSDRSLISHESGVAVDEDGNVYYTWIASDHVAYLAVKRKGEASFGPPIRVSPPNVVDATLPAIEVGAPGAIAIAYVGSDNAPEPRLCGDQNQLQCMPPGSVPTTVEYYADATWNGYITVTRNALSQNPSFVTGTANPPDDPLEKGYCGQRRCGALGDFFDVTIGPDGRAWAAFADHCPAGAETCDGAVYASAYGIVAHMVTGPKLR
jgi:photosystem II stability/assembly factor-like uncharacterized protein